MRRPGGQGGPGGRAATSIIVVAASLALAGCVSLPRSGTVRDVNALPISDQAPGNEVGIIPRAPGPDWSPTDIVSGFLAASGAEAADGVAYLGVAREYLTGTYSKVWHPSTPRVIDTGSQVVGTGPVPHFTNGQTQSDQVTVTSYHLEDLVDGTLQASSRPAPYVFTFLLTTVNGQWRIDSISSLNGKNSDTILLLESSDFLRDYQPRDLYFPASPAATTLVPDPVYIPDGAPQLGVRQLVDLLLKPPPPSSWLNQAVTTAFRPRERPSVQVQGPEVVIDLGGAADRASYRTLQQMRAQLVWTLTGTGIRSVQLQIGTKSWTSYQSDFSGWVPQSRATPQPLYFQTVDRTGHPVIEVVPPGSTAPSQSPPLGLGRGRLTAIAVSPRSPGTNFYTTFAGCRGKTVYVASLLPGGVLLSQPLPSASTACTSLTWDDQGDLFVTAGITVYEITEVPTGLRVITVTTPAQIPDGDTYTSLKVAPDGVRVAMIVRGKNSGGVYVAAIHKEAIHTRYKKGSIVYLGSASGKLLTLGPDVADPVAVSWWDADHLLVLDRRSGRPELRVVPLDGGPSMNLQTPRGAVSITSNGSTIAIDTAGPGRRGRGLVLVSPAPGWRWRTVANGGTPVYPG
jgi:hypothetical protein